MSDNSNEDVTQLDNKIVGQIEYYFSDINLSRDKFMKDLITKDNGWITLEMLLTFNRLKSLSEDKSVIINALQKSDSNLLEVSECLNKIRRRLDKPLPELSDEYIKDFNERTVHLKGFPIDTKLDDIMDFCRRFGSVENIEMRRHFKTKAFKGCIFVVFQDKEIAQKVINTEDLKYLDNNLLRENKVNYLIRKKQYFERKSNKKGAKNKPLSDPMSDEMTAKKEDENNCKPEADVPKSVVRYEGAVLKLKDIDKSTEFMAIKDLFQKYGNVSYVEAVNDNKESFVRFGARDEAKTALEKAKIIDEQNPDLIKVEINGVNVIAEVLTGEEEIGYWTEFEKNRQKNIDKKNEKKFHGKGGRKGKNMWQKNRKRGYKGTGDRNGSKRFKSDSD